MIASLRKFDVPGAEQQRELESLAERRDETLEAAEREHILKVMQECHGQIGGSKGAAARLGMKRTTLQSKLKRLGINPARGPQEN